MALPEQKDKINGFKNPLVIQTFERQSAVVPEITDPTITLQTVQSPGLELSGFGEELTVQEGEADFSSPNQVSIVDVEQPLETGGHTDTITAIQQFIINQKSIAGLTQTDILGRYQIPFLFPTPVEQLIPTTYQLQGAPKQIPEKEGSQLTKAYEYYKSTFQPQYPADQPLSPEEFLLVLQMRQGVHALISNPNGHPSEVMALWRQKEEDSRKEGPILVVEDIYTQDPDSLTAVLRQSILELEKLEFPGLLPFGAVEFRFTQAQIRGKQLKQAIQQTLLLSDDEMDKLLLGQKQDSPILLDRNRILQLIKAWGEEPQVIGKPQAKAEPGPVQTEGKMNMRGGEVKGTEMTGKKDSSMVQDGTHLLSSLPVKEIAQLWSGFKDRLNGDANQAVKSSFFLNTFNAVLAVFENPEAKREDIDVATRELAQVLATIQDGHLVSVAHFVMRNGVVEITDGVALKSKRPGEATQRNLIALWNLAQSDPGLREVKWQVSLTNPRLIEAQAKLIGKESEQSGDFVIFHLSRSELEALVTGWQGIGPNGQENIKTSDNGRVKDGEIEFSEKSDFALDLAIAEIVDDVVEAESIRHLRDAASTSSFEERLSIRCRIVALDTRKRLFERMKTNINKCVVVEMLPGPEGMIDNWQHHVVTIVQGNDGAWRLVSTGSVDRGMQIIKKSSLVEMVEHVNREGLGFETFLPTSEVIEAKISKDPLGRYLIFNPLTGTIKQQSVREIQSKTLDLEKSETLENGKGLLPLELVKVIQALRDEETAPFFKELQKALSLSEEDLSAETYYQQWFVRVTEAELKNNAELLESFFEVIEQHPQLQVLAKHLEPVLFPKTPKTHASYIQALERLQGVVKAAQKFENQPLTEDHYLLPNNLDTALALQCSPVFAKAGAKLQTLIGHEQGRETLAVIHKDGQLHGYVSLEKKPGQWRVMLSNVADSNQDSGETNFEHTDLAKQILLALDEQATEMGAEVVIIYEGTTDRQELMLAEWLEAKQATIVVGKERIVGKIGKVEAQAAAMTEEVKAAISEWLHQISVLHAIHPSVRHLFREPNGFTEVEKVLLSVFQEHDGKIVSEAQVTEALQAANINGYAPRHLVLGLKTRLDAAVHPEFTIWQDVTLVPLKGDRFMMIPKMLEPFIENATEQDWQAVGAAWYLPKASLLVDKNGVVILFPDHNSRKVLLDYLIELVVEGNSEIKQEQLLDWFEAQATKIPRMIRPDTTPEDVLRLSVSELRTWIEPEPRKSTALKSMVAGNNQMIGYNLESLLKPIPFEGNTCPLADWDGEDTGVMELTKPWLVHGIVYAPDREHGQSTSPFLSEQQLEKKYKDVDYAATVQVPSVALKGRASTPALQAIVFGPDQLKQAVVTQGLEAWINRETQALENTKQNTTEYQRIQATLTYLTSLQKLITTEEVSGELILIEDTDGICGLSFIPTIQDGKELKLNASEAEPTFTIVASHYQDEHQKKKSSMYLGTALSLAKLKAVQLLGTSQFTTQLNLASARMYRALVETGIIDWDLTNQEWTELQESGVRRNTTIKIKQTIGGLVWKKYEAFISEGDEEEMDRAIGIVYDDEVETGRKRSHLRRKHITDEWMVAHEAYLQLHQVYGSEFERALENVFVYPDNIPNIRIPLGALAAALMTQTDPAFFPVKITEYPTMDDERTKRIISELIVQFNPETDQQGEVIRYRDILEILPADYNFENLLGTWLQYLRVGLIVTAHMAQDLLKMNLDDLNVRAGVDPIAIAGPISTITPEKPIGELQPKIRTGVTFYRKLADLEEGQLGLGWLGNVWRQRQPSEPLPVVELVNPEDVLEQSRVIQGLLDQVGLSDLDLKRIPYGPHPEGLMAVAKELQINKQVISALHGIESVLNQSDHPELVQANIRQALQLSDPRARGRAVTVALLSGLLPTPAAQALGLNQTLEIGKQDVASKVATLILVDLLKPQLFQEVLQLGLWQTLGEGFSALEQEQADAYLLESQQVNNAIQPLLQSLPIMQDSEFVIYLDPYTVLVDPSEKVSSGSVKSKLESVLDVLGIEFIGTQKGKGLALRTPPDIADTLALIRVLPPESFWGEGGLYTQLTDHYQIWHELHEDTEDAVKPVDADERSREIQTFLQDTQVMDELFNQANLDTWNPQDPQAGPAFSQMAQILNVAKQYQYSEAAIWEVKVQNAFLMTLVSGWRTLAKHFDGTRRMTDPTTLENIRTNLETVISSSGLIPSLDLTNSTQAGFFRDIEGLLNSIRSYHRSNLDDPEIETFSPAWLQTRQWLEGVKHPEQAHFWQLRTEQIQAWPLYQAIGLEALEWVIDLYHHSNQKENIRNEIEHNTEISYPWLVDQLHNQLLSKVEAITVSEQPQIFAEVQALNYQIALDALSLVYRYVKAKPELQPSLKQYYEQHPEGVAAVQTAYQERGSRLAPEKRQSDYYLQSLQDWAHWGEISIPVLAEVIPLTQAPSVETVPGPTPPTVIASYLLSTTQDQLEKLERTIQSQLTAEPFGKVAANLKARFALTYPLRDIDNQQVRDLIAQVLLLKALKDRQIHDFQNHIKQYDWEATHFVPFDSAFQIGDYPQTGNEVAYIVGIMGRANWAAPVAAMRAYAVTSTDAEPERFSVVKRDIDSQLIALHEALTDKNQRENSVALAGLVAAHLLAHSTLRLVQSRLRGLLDEKVKIEDWNLYLNEPRVGIDRLISIYRWMMPRVVTEYKAEFGPNANHAQAIVEMTLQWNREEIRKAGWEDDQYLQTSADRTQVLAKLFEPQSPNAVRDALVEIAKVVIANPRYVTADTLDLLTILDIKNASKAKTPKAWFGDITNHITDEEIKAAAKWWGKKPRELRTDIGFDEELDVQLEALAKVIAYRSWQRIEQVYGTGGSTSQSDPGNGPADPGPKPGQGSGLSPTLGVGFTQSSVLTEALPQDLQHEIQVREAVETIVTNLRKPRIVREYFPQPDGTEESDAAEIDFSGLQAAVGKLVQLQQISSSSGLSLDQELIVGMAISQLFGVAPSINKVLTEEEQHIPAALNLVNPLYQSDQPVIDVYLIDSIRHSRSEWLSDRSHQLQVLQAAKDLTPEHRQGLNQMIDAQSEFALTEPQLANLVDEIAIWLEPVARQEREKRFHDAMQTLTSRIAALTAAASTPSTASNLQSLQVIFNAVTEISIPYGQPDSFDLSPLGTAVQAALGQYDQLPLSQKQTFQSGLWLIRSSFEGLRVPFILEPEYEERWQQASNPELARLLGDQPELYRDIILCPSDWVQEHRELVVDLVRHLESQSQTMLTLKLSSFDFGVANWIEAMYLDLQVKAQGIMNREFFRDRKAVDALSKRTLYIRSVIDDMAGFQNTADSHWQLGLRMVTPPETNSFPVAVDKHFKGAPDASDVYVAIEETYHKLVECIQSAQATEAAEIQAAFGIEIELKKAWDDAIARIGSNPMLVELLDKTAPGWDALHYAQIEGFRSHIQALAKLVTAEETDNGIYRSADDERPVTQGERLAFDADRADQLIKELALIQQKSEAAKQITDQLSAFLEAINIGKKEKLSGKRKQAAEKVIVEIQTLCHILGDGDKTYLTPSNNNQLSSQAQLLLAGLAPDAPSNGRRWLILRALLPMFEANLINDTQEEERCNLWGELVHKVGDRLAVINMLVDFARKGDWEALKGIDILDEALQYIQFAQDYLDKVLISVFLGEGKDREMVVHLIKMIARTKYFNGLLSDEDWKDSKLSHEYKDKWKTVITTAASYQQQLFELLPVGQNQELYRRRILKTITDPNDSLFKDLKDYVKAPTEMKEWEKSQLDERLGRFKVFLTDLLDQGFCLTQEQLQTYESLRTQLRGLFGQTEPLPEAITLPDIEEENHYIPAYWEQLTASSEHPWVREHQELICQTAAIINPLARAELVKLINSEKFEASQFYDQIIFETYLESLLVFDALAQFAFRSEGAQVTALDPIRDPNLLSRTASNIGILGSMLRSADYSDVVDSYELDYEVVLRILKTCEHYHSTLDTSEPIYDSLSQIIAEMYHYLDYPADKSPILVRTLNAINLTLATLALGNGGKIDPEAEHALNLALGVVEFLQGNNQQIELNEERIQAIETTIAELATRGQTKSLTVLEIVANLHQIVTHNNGELKISEPYRKGLREKFRHASWFSRGHLLKYLKEEELHIQGEHQENLTGVNLAREELPVILKIGKTLPWLAIPKLSENNFKLWGVGLKELQEIAKISPEDYSLCQDLEDLIAQAWLQTITEKLAGYVGEEELDFLKNRCESLVRLLQTDSFATEDGQPFRLLDGSRIQDHWSVEAIQEVRKWLLTVLVPQAPMGEIQTKINQEITPIIVLLSQFEVEAAERRSKKTKPNVGEGASMTEEEMAAVTPAGAGVPPRTPGKPTTEDEPDPEDAKKQLLSTVDHLVSQLESASLTETLKAINEPSGLQELIETLESVLSVSGLKLGTEERTQLTRQLPTLLSVFDFPHPAYTQSQKFIVFRLAESTFRLAQLAQVELQLSETQQTAASNLYTPLMVQAGIAFSIYLKAPSDLVDIERHINPYLLGMAAANQLAHRFPGLAADFRSRHLHSESKIFQLTQTLNTTSENSDLIQHQRITLMRQALKETLLVSALWPEGVNREEIIPVVRQALTVLNKGHQAGIYNHLFGGSLDWAELGSLLFQEVSAELNHASRALDFLDMDPELIDRQDLAEASNQLTTILRVVNQLPLLTQWQIGLPKAIRFKSLVNELNQKLQDQALLESEVGKSLADVRNTLGSFSATFDLITEKQQQALLEEIGQNILSEAELKDIVYASVMERYGEVLDLDQLGISALTASELIQTFEPITAILPARREVGGQSLAALKDRIQAATLDAFVKNTLFRMLDNLLEGPFVQTKHSRHYAEEDLDPESRELWQVLIGALPQKGEIAVGYGLVVPDRYGRVKSFPKVALGMLVPYMSDGLYGQYLQLSGEHEALFTAVKKTQPELDISIKVVGWDRLSYTDKNDFLDRADQFVVQAITELLFANTPTVQWRAQTNEDYELQDLVANERVLKSVLAVLRPIQTADLLKIPRPSLLVERINDDLMNHAQISTLESGTIPFLVKQQPQNITQQFSTILSAVSQAESDTRQLVAWILEHKSIQHALRTYPSSTLDQNITALEQEVNGLDQLLQVEEYRMEIQLIRDSVQALHELLKQLKGGSNDPEGSFSGPNTPSPSGPDSGKTSPTQPGASNAWKISDPRLFELPVTQEPRELQDYLDYAKIVLTEQQCKKLESADRVVPESIWSIVEAVFESQVKLFNSNFRLKKQPTDTPKIRHHVFAIVQYLSELEQYRDWTNYTELWNASYTKMNQYLGQLCNRSLLTPEEVNLLGRALAEIPVEGSHLVTSSGSLFDRLGLEPDVSVPDLVFEAVYRELNSRSLAIIGILSTALPGDLDTRTKEVLDKTLIVVQSLGQFLPDLAGAMISQPEEAFLYYHRDWLGILNQINTVKKRWGYKTNESRMLRALGTVIESYLKEHQHHPAYQKNLQEIKTPQITEQVAEGVILDLMKKTHEKLGVSIIHWLTLPEKRLGISQASMVLPSVQFAVIDLETALPTQLDQFSHHLNSITNQPLYPWLLSLKGHPQHTKLLVQINDFGEPVFVMPMQNNLMDWTQIELGETGSIEEMAQRLRASHVWRLRQAQGVSQAYMVKVSDDAQKLIYFIRDQLMYDFTIRHVDDLPSLQNGTGSETIELVPIMIPQATIYHWPKDNGPSGSQSGDPNDTPIIPDTLESGGRYKSSHLIIAGGKVGERDLPALEIQATPIEALAENDLQELRTFYDQQMGDESLPFDESIVLTRIHFIGVDGVEDAVREKRSGMIFRHYQKIDDGGKRLIAFSYGLTQAGKVNEVQWHVAIDSMGQGIGVQLARAQLAYFAQNGISEHMTFLTTGGKKVFDQLVALGDIVTYTMNDADGEPAIKHEVNFQVREKLGEIIKLSMSETQSQPDVAHILSLIGNLTSSPAMALPTVLAQLTKIAEQLKQDPFLAANLHAQAELGVAVTEAMNQYANDAYVEPILHRLNLALTRGGASPEEHLYAWELLIDDLEIDGVITFDEREGMLKRLKETFKQPEDVCELIKFYYDPADNTFDRSALKTALYEQRPETANLTAQVTALLRSLRTADAEVSIPSDQDIDESTQQFVVARQWCDMEGRLLEMGVFSPVAVRAVIRKLYKDQRGPLVAALALSVALSKTETSVSQLSDEWLLNIFQISHEKSAPYLEEDQSFEAFAAHAQSVHKFGRIKRYLLQRLEDAGLESENRETIKAVLLEIDAFTELAREAIVPPTEISEKKHTIKQEQWSQDTAQKIGRVIEKLAQVDDATLYYHVMRPIFTDRLNTDDPVVQQWLKDQLSLLSQIRTNRMLSNGSGNQEGVQTVIRRRSPPTQHAGTPATSLDQSTLAAQSKVQAFLHNPRADSLERLAESLEKSQPLDLATAELRQAIQAYSGAVEARTQNGTLTEHKQKILRALAQNQIRLDTRIVEEFRYRVNGSDTSNANKAANGGTLRDRLAKTRRNSAPARIQTDRELVESHPITQQERLQQDLELAWGLVHLMSHPDNSLTQDQLQTIEAWVQVAFVSALRGNNQLIEATGGMDQAVQLLTTIFRHANRSHAAETHSVQYLAEKTAELRPLLTATIITDLIHEGTNLTTGLEVLAKYELHQDTNGTEAVIQSLQVQASRIERLVEVVTTILDKLSLEMSLPLRKTQEFQSLQRAVIQFTDRHLGDESLPDKLTELASKLNVEDLSEEAYKARLAQQQRWAERIKALAMSVIGKGQNYSLNQKAVSTILNLGLKRFQEQGSFEEETFFEAAQAWIQELRTTADWSSIQSNPELAFEYLGQAMEVVHWQNLGYLDRSKPVYELMIWINRIKRFQLSFEEQYPHFVANDSNAINTATITEKFKYWNISELYNDTLKPFQLYSVLGKDLDRATNLALAINGFQEAWKSEGTFKNLITKILRKSGMLENNHLSPKVTPPPRGDQLNA